VVPTKKVCQGLGLLSWRVIDGKKDEISEHSPPSFFKCANSFVRTFSSRNVTGPHLIIKQREEEESPQTQQKLSMHVCFVVSCTVPSFSYRATQSISATTAIYHNAPQPFPAPICLCFHLCCHQVGTPGRYTNCASLLTHALNGAESDQLTHVVAFYIDREVSIPIMIFLPLPPLLSTTTTTATPTLTKRALRFLTPWFPPHDTAG